MKSFLIFSFFWMWWCADSQAQTISYLALGDSYVIGEGVDSSQRCPVYLQQELTKAAFKITSFQLIARTGWTTSELLSRLKKEKWTKQYDLVTLQIGVNDQYRRHSVVQYEKDFTEILKYAISLCKRKAKRVIVLSIPDWGVTPYAKAQKRANVAQEIDQFNAINKKVCEKLGCTFVDITDISREAAQKPNLLAQDGLHPSGEMYYLWAQRLKPVAISMFQK